MNICHVVAGLGLGGAGTLVLNLALHQIRGGHRVYVVNIHRDTALEPWFLQAGVPLYHVLLTPVLSIWYPHSLVRCLRKIGAEVVHAHNASWRKAVAACSVARVPCIWTLHGYHSEWLKQGRHWIERAVSKTATLVGVEDGVARLLEHELGLGEDKVVCIPNGVPDTSGTALPEDAHRLVPPGSQVVGMATRMAPPKDYDTLVRAFAAVRQVVPTAHLLLVGDGPLREHVIALVRKLGLLCHVTLTGLRQDVPSIVKLMDVFVHSSLSESISVAILEAMANSRPIVATAVGGTPGVLANGDCGVLVPPGDSQAMASAIIELLGNRERAQTLAQRARQRFLQEYTINRMADRYMAVYLSAILRSD